MITKPSQARFEVAIVGLGYVGLPLAVAFGRQLRIARSRSYVAPMVLTRHLPPETPRTVLHRRMDHSPQGLG